MHLDALLRDLTVLFAVAVGVVLLVRRVGLPPIVGLLLAGVVVGPDGLALVHDPEQVELLAELGVALVLFTVGLEVSPRELARQGRAVFLGGGAQVGLSLAGAAIAAVAVGGSWRMGIFWGCLAALSSTAIVLRGLADRGESPTPYGRIVLGILVFQDLCFVPMALALPILAGHGGGAAAIGWQLGRAALVIVGMLLLAHKVVPWLLARVAAVRSRDVFVLTILGVALGVASATAAVGLSLALGAFLAGVVIADTDFVHQAGSEVAPLRDTFASLFFLSIGMLLDPAVLAERPMLVLAVAGALVVGKAVIAAAATLLLRLPASTAVRTGVALAQVGELSFVLLRSGEDLGLVSEPGARVFVAASVLTMAVTPLLLAAGPHLARLAVGLQPIEDLLHQPGAEPTEAPQRDHVVVAGLGLGGQLLLAALQAAGVPYLGVDLDPEALRRLRAQGHPVRYGDVTRDGVLAEVAHADHAKLLVLLLTDDAATVRAAAAAHRACPALPVLARAHRTHRDRADLSSLGIEIVWEDYEATLEILERVLGRLGPTGTLVRDAVSAVRSTRAPQGGRQLEAGTLLAGMQLDSVALAATAWAVGRTLGDTNVRAVTGSLAVAVARGPDVTPSPGPDVRLRPGDVLILSGTRPQLDLARRYLVEGPAVAELPDARSP
jgi:CPA2 family monovalent cation:H+ antiporter-2